MSSPQSPQSPQPRQPNILFILTDHQAFYGHHRPGEFEYVWPHYRDFCAAGVRFDRAYCVAPICTPARSSMLSGQYPSRHGLMWNTEVATPDNRTDFRNGTRLFSHHLEDAGYRNAYIGKWHCGHRLLAEDYGWEGWSLPDYGKKYMSGAYRDYCRQRGLGPATALIEHHINRPQWRGERHVQHHQSPWWFMNGSGVLDGPPDAHEDFFVANLAIDTLRQLAAGSRPWSLVASFWGPHQPFYPTEPYASMVDPRSIPPYPTFDDDLSGRPLRYVMHRDFNHRSRAAWPAWATWQEVLARAYGQGYQCDAAIGNLLAALDATGQADDTLVVWCADHGDALASHGGLWDKASTYIEEVARVPLAARWPNAFNGGRTVSRPVTNMDVTATFLEAAGCAVPADMDSRSLLPLCRDRADLTDPADPPAPDAAFTQHHGHGDRITQRIIITERYKYVAALFDGDELYDLQNDPYEVRNLVETPQAAAVKAELRGRLIDHLQERDDRPAAKLLHALRLGY